jgi:hypothetical protein
MRVVAQSEWSWTLLENQEGFFLRVLCGSVGLFSIEFRLNAQEAAMLAERPEEGVAELAMRVRDDPGAYMSRHLGDFNERSDVKKAALEWRRMRRREPWKGAEKLPG